MQATQGESLLVMTAVPADLRQALEADGHRLVDLSSQPPGPVTGFRIGVTSAMAGCDAAMFSRIQGMKLLASTGTGLDRIDLDAARAAGCAVLNTPDVLTEDTADYAIALLYGIARRVVYADAFVRSGAWTKGRPESGTRLFGKTCGIFGLGRIGAAVARRAQGIGMKVLWSGPRPKPEAPWGYVPSLAELAEKSDVLVMCCPGGAETAGIVNAGILQKLGAAGFLINIARGSVVDEAALVAALRDGTIRGAGTDVFQSEPVPDPAMLAAPNMVVAPHYASLTRETRVDIVRMIVEGIGAFQAGRPHHDATRG
ncbi:NAD(P)-dependent oxidoreductase [Falsiroseomonas tokyonensis]|uniref:NAD(P)-dependent oxidoreductase n=1 Tax=Falsiroseomonas tokyonensis TaxID=430521 RepID=A0ABV7BQR0_9PROT|nr:NAD(P)-dependent oxidoreductase [Falsiroseomonas tokyonensis]MBU8536806.1 2-hydroxyacid dehydrogenase [Falsiroseomonas tokyonensis]